MAELRQKVEIPILAHLAPRSCWWLVSSKQWHVLYHGLVLVQVLSSCGICLYYLANPPPHVFLLSLFVS